MPARLIVGERLALARSVGCVDFTGRREDQKSLAVEVYVRIRFELRLCLSNGRFPAAITQNLIEGILRDLLESVLVYVHHGRFVLLFPYQLTEKSYHMR